MKTAILIISITMLVASLMYLWFGYKLSKFNKEIEDVFKDCFNQKTDNNGKE